MFHRQKKKQKKLPIIMKSVNALLAALFYMAFIVSAAYSSFDPPVDSNLQVNAAMITGAHNQKRAMPMPGPATDMEDVSANM